MLMVLASPQDTQTTETESAKPEEPCPQDTHNSSIPKSPVDRDEPTHEPAATTNTNILYSSIQSQLIYGLELNLCSPVALCKKY